MSRQLTKMSDMVGTVLSQKARRLHLFRNESSFARSDAEQRPDHAGRQYVMLARMAARNTSWSDLRQIFSIVRTIAVHDQFEMSFYRATPCCDPVSVCVCLSVCHKSVFYYNS